MGMNMMPVAQSAITSGDYDMRDLIGAIGRPSFAGKLANCLNQIFRSEAIYIFHGPMSGAQKVVPVNCDGSEAAWQPLDFYAKHGMWRFDPDKAAGTQWDSVKPAMFLSCADEAESYELRAFYDTQNISERVSICGRAGDSKLGLCMLRSNELGRFTEEERFKLRMISDVAYPLMVRHFDLLREDKALPVAFTSLALIEDCISMAPQVIPRREVEVIARMLYGISAEGTALALGIGKETVISYRKRFYMRIGISGFRELLIWYLGLFGVYRHHFYRDVNLNQMDGLSDVDYSQALMNVEYKRREEDLTELGVAGSAVN